MRFRSSEFGNSSVTSGSLLHRRSDCHFTEQREKEPRDAFLMINFLAKVTVLVFGGIIIFLSLDRARIR